MLQLPPNLNDLGVAPAGWKWQGEQRELVERIINSPKKIILFQGEPGSGKTLIAAASIWASAARGIILVQNRQLEEQYLRDFPQFVMMDGRRHSKCLLTEQPADTAPCLIGVRCRYAGRFGRGGEIIVWPDCPYFQKKLRAATARVSVHNYAYWLLESLHVGTFKQTQWLVADEGHLLDRILMQVPSLTVMRAQLDDYSIDQPPDKIGDFVAWAAEAAQQLEPQLKTQRSHLIEQGVLLDSDSDDLTFESTDTVDWDDEDTLSNVVEILQQEEIRNAVTQLYHGTQLLETLKQSVNIKPDEWILQHEKNLAAAKPIFGRPIFQHMREAARSKILIQSAYLAPLLLRSNLGISAEESEVIEASEVYDRTKSKIYFCSVGRLSYKTTPARWKAIVGVVDRFIDYYYPQKGVIHVPSLKLRNTVRDNTRYRSSLVTYEGNGRGLTKPAALDIFRKRKTHAVLVGQSVSTGMDLPYAFQWQIIAKLPFPTITDPQIEARMAVDPLFYPSIVICELVQAAGRIKRADDDDGDTIILDGHFGWFYQKYRVHFPFWFTKNLVLRGWNSFKEVQQEDTGVVETG